MISRDRVQCEPSGDGKPEVHVRMMLPDDIQAVLEIEHRSFPTPWSEQVFNTEITRNPNAHYIVAARGRDLVGYAGMWLLRHEAHITNIAVDPDERGMGIGARLLRSLMSRARAAEVGRITLEVRVSNEIATQFYRKYGFTTKGLRHGYYTDTGEDALVMVCRDIESVLRR